MSGKIPLAYRTDELPFSRSKAYSEIAAGRLRAVKLGRRTLILTDDLWRYLASLPPATRRGARGKGLQLKTIALTPTTLARQLGSLMGPC